MGVGLADLDGVADAPDALDEDLAEAEDVDEAEGVLEAEVDEDPEGVALVEASGVAEPLTEGEVLVTGLVWAQAGSANNTGSITRARRIRMSSLYTLYVH